MKALITSNGLLTRSANLFTGKSSGQGVREANVPKPTISDHEILVKVSATSLNPIDAKFIDFIAPSGAVAGCDYAGVIEEIGNNAPSKWKVGDRVAGFVQGGIDQVRGAFAEYVKVEADLAWKISDGVSDEDAATYGIAAATAMQALHLHLDISWDNAPEVGDKITGAPIFIYAGSSSVGLFAIQLAKRAGLMVVTTASPHSFDLVKRYGADEVFDYHEPTAVESITKAFPNIAKAIDCFSEGKSTQFCAEVVQKQGGKVITLLDSKSGVTGVKVEMIMSFQLLGQPFSWLPPIGPKYPASPTERAALVQFYIDLTELAVQVKPPPITLIEGGFHGIIEGLNRLRAKQVSGSKLVVKI